MKGRFALMIVDSLLVAFGVAVIGFLFWMLKRQMDTQRANRKDAATPLFEHLRDLLLNLQRDDWAMIALLDQFHEPMEIAKDRLRTLLKGKQLRKLDGHWVKLASFRDEVQKFNEQVYGKLYCGDVLPQLASAKTPIEQDIRSDAKPIVEEFLEFIRKEFID